MDEIKDTKDPETEKSDIDEPLPAAEPQAAEEPAAIPAADILPYAEAEPEPEAPQEAEPPVNAKRYRIFAAIFTALTLGGLFLGLLGNLMSWLKPSYYSGNSGLNNSLLGFFFTRMRELFGIGGGFGNTMGVIFQNVFAVIAACLLLFTVLISVVTLVVSLASAKRAKTATLISGTASLLAYTLFFVWAFCVNSLSMGSFGAKAIDMPVALITLFLFIAMTVYAVLEKGRKSLFGIGIYCFSVAASLSLFFPGSFPETHFGLFAEFSANAAYNLAVIVAVIVVLFNVIVSVVAFLLSKGTIRTIMFTVQLIAVLLLAIAGCWLKGGSGLQFFQNSAFLPSIILILSSLGAMVLSIVVLFFDRNAQEQTEEAEAEEAAEAAETEEGAEWVGETEEAQPVAMEARAEAEALGAPEDGLLASMDAEPEVSEPSPEVSAFEREMISLAEKGAEEAVPAEAMPEVPPQPYPQYAAPVFRPVNVYTDPSMQYVYDPFINELTPEEKNEFGDLFIACKSGKYGDLPVYHIGGDNKEFFDKVWIRYGLYDMSQPLRDKLFSYLRRYRSRQQ